MTDKKWERVQLGRKCAAVKRGLYVCCSYSETGIITVLESVTRIRLLKTENPNVCLTVNCKMCRTDVTLYCL
jgi:hypothetical protein